MIDYRKLISRSIIEEDYVSPNLEFPIEIDIKLEKTGIFTPTGIFTIEGLKIGSLDSFSISLGVPKVKEEILPESNSSLSKEMLLEMAKAVQEKYLEQVDKMLYTSTGGRVEVLCKENEEELMPGSNPPMSKKEYLKYLDEIL